MKERQAHTIGRRANPRKQYKLDNRAVLSPDPPFAPEGLREAIQNALGEKYAPPDNAEAIRLCGILNSWHAWFYEAQEQRKFNDAVECAASALEKLRAVLPVIGKHHLKKADRGDPFAAWQVRAVADLIEAIEKDPKRITHCVELPDQARDWRWLAEVLPLDIESAMRPANPNYPSGHSKTGPLARILAAVIPDITGEHVTEKAVGTQLVKILKASGLTLP